MLYLKRIQYFNEFMRDSFDDRIIGPGEYYYQSDVTRDVISCQHYWELKKQYLEDTWDDSWLNYMESERDYKEQLRLAQQDYKLSGILNEEIFSENIRGDNENTGKPSEYSHAPNQL